MNRPQMYKSTSNVQLSDWMGLKCTAVWLTQTESASNVRNLASNVRIRTFEADFLYIWGRVNLFCHVMCLSQSDSCTFEAHPIRQLYIWGREKLVSNVQIGLKCRYIWGQIPYIWGWSDSTGRGSAISHEISKTGQERCDSGPRISRVQSASNVRTKQGSAIGHGNQRDWPGEVQQWPKDRTPSPDWPQMYVRKLASNVQISLKCTDRPQMYRSASNVQILIEIKDLWPIWYHLSIYLSALLKSVSVHLRPIRTFEADFLYIWGPF